MLLDGHEPGQVTREGRRTQAEELQNVLQQTIVSTDLYLYEKSLFCHVALTHLETKIPARGSC